jgi:hypothetical protein
MPWISFKNLTEEDLGAIYQALLSTHPVDHKIMNRAPLSYCEVCGRKHGLGDQNHKLPIKSFTNDFKIAGDLPGTYYNIHYNKDTLHVVSQEGKLAIDNGRNKWVFLPVNDSTFISDGFFAPVVFKSHQGILEPTFSFQILEENKFIKITN